MLTMHEIKAHYNLTETNEARLQALLPLAEAHRQVIADKFYDYLLGMPETAELIRNEEVLERLRTTHQQWFLNLFNGRYDNQYLLTLQRIGSAHVKSGVNAHFVNAAMNLVRQCFLNVIESSFSDREERRAHREALNKILDINLDVMTASYREEELKKVFLHRRLESKLIGAAERFTYGLNLILVLALAGVSVAVIGLFFWDIAQIFHGKVEKAILGALGTLLIIWMMIELMDNEIKNLKGGKFNILVFIGVIMVALIREILISTLRHDALETQVFLAGTLLILGVVYFLVAKSQSLSPHQ